MRNFAFVAQRRKSKNTLIVVVSIPDKLRAIYLVNTR